MRFSGVLVLVLFALAGVLALAGWFEPAIFPDTAGYIELAKGPNPWGEARHPLYGWILIGLSAVGFSQAAIPALQFGLHGVAVLALFYAARAWGLEVRAALALALAALLNQALVIWGRGVLPEMAAISFMLLALSATLMAARGTRFWLWAVLAMLACGIACTLRPIMLPVVVIFPLLFMMLARISGMGWNVARAFVLGVLLVSPIVGQATYRLAKVGDFGLVSFGGLGSVGVAAQILTPDLVTRLPESQRPLAEQFLTAKERAVLEQKLMPLVRNSVGERSFQTSALDGFDVLARNFDDLVWTHALLMRQPGETWVAFNVRMGAFGSAVFRAAPERLVLWQAGAFARLVGRLFAYNAAFLLALGVFGLVALMRIARSGTALGGNVGTGWTPLVLIVLSWTTLSTVLTVLVAFPAQRYADTGGILLAALPLYGAFLGLSSSGLAKTSRDAPM